jgi:hypothetical protein
MMRQGMPTLLATLGIDPAKTVFMPALASGETQAKADGQIPVLARRFDKAAYAATKLRANDVFVVESRSCLAATYSEYRHAKRRSRASNIRSLSGGSLDAIE